MGWTTTYRQPKTPVIAFFSKEFDFDKPDEGVSGKVLACSASRSVAYLAYEVKNPEETRVIAIVCLIQYYPKDPNYNFGYKDMDESAGPYEAECPEKIMRLLTPLKPDEKYASEWREKCWKNIDKKKKLSKDLRVAKRNNMSLKFALPFSFGRYGSEDTFKVASMSPLRFRTQDGLKVKITRRSIIHSPYILEA